MVITCCGVLWWSMHAATSAGAFYSAYHARLGDLRRAASDPATEHARAVDALIDARRELQRAPPLPPRDVLQYEGELRAIQRIIAERARPGGVFRFRRPECCADAPAAPRAPSAEERAPPAAHAPTNICGRRDCVIALDTLPTLYVSDVHGSVLVAPRVHGSVLAEGCTHTTLVAVCGQLRVSRSAHMTLVVDTPAKVTLDECTDVAVGGVHGTPSVQDFGDVHDTRRNWRALSHEESESICAKYGLARGAPAHAVSSGAAAPA